MSSTAHSGLARITVVTPDRRVDLALPTNVAVAGILPSLLQHAGDAFADNGEQHGGWTLRRTDGAELRTQETLGAQQVRDGELIHLVPRHQEWPEVDYDDVVHTIAAGARRYGQPWSPATTRLAALLVATAVLAVAMVVLLLSGPSWQLPGGVALGLALLLVITGVALSRAMADSLAGVFLAALGLPFAFAGGVLVVAADGRLTDAGAPQLLLGSVLLAGAGLLGYAGVADRARIFAGGITAGLVGATGSGLTLAWLDPVPATSVMLAAVVLLTPVAPLLAIRLGKIPVPALPESAGEILDDKPQVPAPQVFAAVARTDEILTGVLLGGSVAGAVCLVPLSMRDGIAVPLLVLVSTLAFLLRTRLFLATRQRVPLLVTGLVGGAVIVIDFALGLSHGQRALVPVIGLAVIAAAVVTAGLVFSRRGGSPYFGRFLELFDAALLMSVVPITCGAAGVFQAVRGNFG